MTELLLVRHGVTPWNRERRFQGATDIALDADGQRQASLIAARLASARIDAVYSSDLLRARQTAQPIADALGLPVMQARGLRERAYGDFEGRTHQDIAQAFPQAWANWRARDPFAVIPGGGESLVALAARARDALVALAIRHRGGRIVAVTHGGVLDCVYRIASGLSLSDPLDQPILNTSLNRIGWDGSGFTVLGWGDIAHLDPSLPLSR